MKLVVGLGNPGPRYADTRHNVGFRVLEALADLHAIALDASRFEGRFGRGRVGHVDLALLLPQTFMNRSGRAVGAALEALGLDASQDLLVVVDDVDLPFGRLRLRPTGGHGGHRGLRDVIEVLGRHDFSRLRVGVGRPSATRATTDHVLGSFSADEQASLGSHLARAADAVGAWLQEGPRAAMDRYNRGGEERVAGEPRRGPGDLVKCGVPRADAFPEVPRKARAVASTTPEPLPRPMSAPDETFADAGPRLAERLARPFLRFMELETSSAILLLAMTVAALVWANSPYHESYEHFWHTPLSLSLGDASLTLGLGHWVNDGLMAIFFFLVGMEIKRELVLGELSSRARAMLPVMGALGGMVAPALIYAAFHMGGPAISGWGIPMATDIAFAVAAMSVFGRRVPSGLKVFLLALAIADDLGAVLVIAVFYTAHLSLSALGTAALVLGLIYALNQAGVRSYLVYWALGAVVWYFTHESGVHATVAGVALGLLTPLARPPVAQQTLVQRGRSALQRLAEMAHLSHTEDKGGHKRHHLYRELRDVGQKTLPPLDFLTNQLERVVLFVIMPIFALANAGVHLEAETLSDPLGQRVGIAVALGLLVGKPIGITIFSWVSVRMGLAVLPRGVNWTAIFATGVLAGIGFTVALFISALAFQDPHFTAGSKVGILVGSTLATVIGLFVLSRALPREAPEA